MLIVLALIAVFSLGFWIAWIAKPDARWYIEAPPEDADRGPNADGFYWTIFASKTNYWFTQEQVQAAKLRAEKYKR